MGLSRAVSSVSVARVFGRGTPAALALLKAAWPSAVGPELARRTEVLALEGSSMRVRIPDARWRKVLHRMQPEILARLRGVAGDLAPRRLGFSEGGSFIDPPPLSPPHVGGGGAQKTEYGRTAASPPHVGGGGTRETEYGRTAASPPHVGGGGTRETESGRSVPYPHSSPALADGVAAAASQIEDPEIRARFERSAARYLAAFRR